MSWTDRWAAPPASKPVRELRKFGITMAVALAAVGGLLLFRHRPSGMYFVWVAAGFVVAGLAAPQSLAPVERGWMAFAERLGHVTTAIILTLSFYLMVTPLGLLRRLFSNDSLGLKPDPSAKSYWVPAEPDGPASRPDKPF